MKKGIPFCIVALVCWVLAGVMIVHFVKVVSERNETLATLTAPANAEFALTEAGKVSLWHNYQGVVDGVTVNDDPVLPSGFGFELIEVATGRKTMMRSAHGVTTVRIGDNSKVLVGVFHITTPGDYELVVTSPAGEQRYLSLTKGTFGEGFKELFGIVGTATLLGLVGFIFLILGIIFMFVKSPPKSQPPTPLSNAS